MRWRVILSLPLDGPHNMALDRALMQRARETRESVLRVYSWSMPVLSLGRNQTALGVYDLDALEQRGITVVRRPTGGRALLHHREITYSVTAPVTDGLNQTYREVNGLLVHALGQLGVRAEIARAPSRNLPPSAIPCFAEPATGEIVVDGRKLVGSAQWRDDGALLQHGSIIVEDDQALIPSLMLAPQAPPPPPATLRQVLGRSPTPAELADVLFDSLVALADPQTTLLSADEVATPEVDTGVAHFRDPTWTWRR